MKKLLNIGSELTNKLPDKEGFYWFTDFGEHTPTIVYVKKGPEGFFAENGEFNFLVVVPKIDDTEERIPGHFEGEELWCFIPNPIIDGKEVELNSY